MNLFSCARKRALFSQRAAVIIALAAVGGAFSCAAVQEIKTQAAVGMALPRMRLVSASVASTSTSDYKLRLRPNKQIRLVVRLGSAQGVELDATSLDIIYRKLAAAMRMPNLLLRRPQDQRLKGFPGSQDSRTYLQGENADGLLDVTVRGESVLLELKDPVTGRELARRRLGLRSTTLRRDPAHQADFYVRARGRSVTVSTLESRPGRLLELSGAERAALRRLVLKSVSGRLFVYAGAPGTTVYLRKDGVRRRLGKTPVLNYTMREGVAVIEVRRRGYRAFVERVQIRAGRVRNVYALWADSTRVSSLVVRSAPSGLRVALDGVVRGTTPLFLTELRPQAYSLELSRPDGTGGYTVASESTVNVLKTPQERVVFINYADNFQSQVTRTGYWHLFAEQGSVSQKPGKGLALLASSSVPSWAGLVTRPFLTNSFRVDFNLLRSKKNSFGLGLLGTGQAVLLEYQGDVLRFGRFQGGRTVGTVRSFRPVSDKPSVPLTMVFDRGTGKLTVSIGGSKIFQGPWQPGAAARVALMTRAGSGGAGAILGGQLRIRSGRGMYSE